MMNKIERKERGVSNIKMWSHGAMDWPETGKCFKFSTQKIIVTRMARA